MKSTKFALSAALVLAITLTFSCSGDDGDPDDNPSSSSQKLSSSLEPSSSSGKPPESRPCCTLEDNGDYFNVFVGGDIIATVFDPEAIGTLIGTCTNSPNILVCDISCTDSRLLCDDPSKQF